MHCWFLCKPYMKGAWQCNTPFNQQSGVCSLHMKIVVPAAWHLKLGTSSWTFELQFQVRIWRRNVVGQKLDMQYSAHGRLNCSVRWSCPCVRSFDVDICNLQQTQNRSAKRFTGSRTTGIQFRMTFVYCVNVKCTLCKVHVFCGATECWMCDTVFSGRQCLQNWHNMCLMSGEMGSRNTKLSYTLFLTTSHLTRHYAHTVTVQVTQAASRTRNLIFSFRARTDPVPKRRARVIFRRVRKTAKSDY